ncbi:hypothetical protein AB0H98_05995, partial [Nocardia salmonicida]|uniref:hypothetical protein n=1 Tax=Nocardia salmonicida TaxID=53431 RepID=UPI003410D1D1
MTVSRRLGTGSTRTISTTFDCSKTRTVEASTARRRPRKSLPGVHDSALDLAHAAEEAVRNAQFAGRALLDVASASASIN